MIWHTFFQPFIEFGFMRRALAVCLALSLSTTILGVLLLLRRMSLMGDALSHAILPVWRWVIWSTACRCWQ